MSELRTRILRIKVGAEETNPVEQLRDNLRRVVSFVLQERELTDILLNHSSVSIASSMRKFASFTIASRR